MYRGQGLLRDDLVMKFLINMVIFKYEVLFLFFDLMALDFSMDEGGFIGFDHCLVLILCYSKYPGIERCLVGILPDLLII